MTDGEKVMTVIRWYAHDEVSQEESEHKEVDEMKKGVDLAISKFLVIRYIFLFPVRIGLKMFSR